MNNSRQTTAVTVIIILILVLVGTLYLYNRNKDDTNTSSTNTTNTATPTPSPTTVGESPTATALSNDVSIVNFIYTPQTITVTRGSTITWTNNDTAAHTVTSSGNFDSGNMAKGDKYSHTFDTVGEFNYICTYHPNMTGKVIVVEPGT